MNEVHASEPFRTLFAREDAFAWLAAQTGPVFRAAPGRRTLRFEYAGAAWFLKLHAGVGWREILKNLLFLRAPVLDARREAVAAAALAAAGVPTLDVMAWGRAGRNPARRRSFIVTRPIPAERTLDDVAHAWLSTEERNPVLKRRVIRRVAELVRRMHGAGIHHRDLYLVHFLVSDLPDGLHLIDLHRAGIGRLVRRRWLVKDLGSLDFAAGNALLTQRDRLRFLAAYRGRPLREILPAERGFWAAVLRRSRRLHRRTERKGRDR
ncbi:MAG: lipopolysaccharide core heptose(I) kinase RfaP [Gammaproteobacteria bacterium]|nr:MAG: lipopolysaccharide core heptose(I) kinase RfaP [Gammaproteobacteria bacterium]